MQLFVKGVSGAPYCKRSAQETYKNFACVFVGKNNKYSMEQSLS